MIRNFLGYFLIILLELPQICKHYNKRDKNKRVTFHEELNNKHIYLKIQYFLLFCILYCEFFLQLKGGSQHLCSTILKIVLCLDMFFFSPSLNRGAARRHHTDPDRVGARQGRQLLLTHWTLPVCRAGHPT